MSEKSPLTPPIETANGRDTHGRFARGNAGGPGNPNLAALNRHRGAMLDAVKDTDITKAMKVVKSILADKKCKAADRLTAVRILLDRTVGTPVQSDLLERIEALEKLFAERGAAGPGGGSQLRLTNHG